MGKWLQFGDYKMLPADKAQKKKLRAVITHQYIYEYNDGRVFTTPLGQETDGASIPDALELVAGSNFQDGYIPTNINPNLPGSYVPSAFIHDILCKLGKAGAPVCSWEDTHKIFYQSMLDNGCPKNGLHGAWVKYQSVKFWMFFTRWKY